MSFIPIVLGNTGFSTVSFFIDQLNLPIAPDRLYGGIGFFYEHLITLLSAVSVITLTLLIRQAYLGNLQIQMKKLTAALFGIFSFFVVFIFLTHPLFHWHDYYEGLYGSLKLTDVIPNPVKARIIPPGKRERREILMNQYSRKSSKLGF